MLPQRIWAVKNQKGPMRPFIILFLLLPCNTRLLLFGVFFLFVFLFDHFSVSSLPPVSTSHHHPRWRLTLRWSVNFLMLFLFFDCHFLLLLYILWLKPKAPPCVLCTQNQKSCYVLYLIALRINPRFPKRLHSRPPALSIYLSCGLSSSNAPSSSLMKRASGRNVERLPPCFTWCIG